MRWIYYLATLLFFTIQAFSQNETQKWYFGNHCGLDFSTNPPTVIPSPNFNSMEGGASISDASGNLLFYTDAVTVWNSAHAVMANGAGLFGNLSSTQSSIIVKQPGSASVYYLFTQEDSGKPNGLRYSVVDMSLAAGMGSVTVKNILLNTPSCEKLNAVKHCNGTDVWIVTHDYNSDVFRAHLVTAAGISATPVLSAIGPVLSNLGYFSVLKISPNGRKIAMPMLVSNSIEFFDFNPGTGVVSNHFTIGKVPSYGCEFSPDGSRFYSGVDNIYQWDLCAGSTTAIQNSSVTIFTNNLLSPTAYQSAPNGKIYISILGESSLAVINDPDLSGTSCNFNIAGQTIGSGIATMSLPNFVVSYFKPALTFSSTQNCSIISFTAPPVTSSGCGSVPTFTSSSWFFSDPGSGALNTSSLTIVTHTFSTPGTYKVKHILYSDCGTDTITQEFNVLATPLFASLSSSGVCSGNSATLQATGANTYSWSSGATTSSIVISPTSNTNYTVTGFYSTGCANTNSTVIISVPVYSLPALHVTGPSSVCLGSEITLTVSGATSYTWNTGATTHTMSNAPAANTSYTVSGTDPNGCVNTNTFSVSTFSLPALIISGTTLVCPGTGGTLSVNGAETYTWITGINTNTFFTAPFTNTTYSVSGKDLNGCINSATITVAVKTLPNLSLNSPSVCSGASVLLGPLANPATGITYTWQPGGASTASILVAPVSNSSYTVNASFNGCQISYSTSVSVIPISSPTLDFVYKTPLCINDHNPFPDVKSDFSFGGVFYSSPDLILDEASGVIDLTSSGPGTFLVTYSLQAKDCISSGSKTAAVTIREAPSLTVSPDMKVAPDQATMLEAKGGSSYAWSPLTDISCIDCYNPVVSPKISTMYCVTTSALGCSSRACINVEVGCDGGDLSLPNAFTPNGDGHNDAFCLQGWDLCISHFNVLIFNRWGEKIYESANPDFCWDGTFQGKLLDNEVFIYSITASFKNGDKVDKKGNITLLR